MSSKNNDYIINKHVLGAQAFLLAHSSATYVQLEPQSGSLKYSIREPVGDFYNVTENENAIRSYLNNLSFSMDNNNLKISTNCSFVDRLRELIIKSGFKNSDVYKAAGIDRRLFSKIISDSNYRPAKDTAIAFALALQLNFSEADELLSRAGYTFSKSLRRDIIIEYFFNEKEYELSIINEVLFKLGEKPLGA